MGIVLAISIIVNVILALMLYKWLTEPPKDYERMSDDGYITYLGKGRIKIQEYIDVEFEFDFNNDTITILKGDGLVIKDREGNDLILTVANDEQPYTT